MAPEYPYPWLHPSKDLIRNGQEPTPDKRFMPEQLLFYLADEYPNTAHAGLDLRSLIRDYQNHCAGGRSDTFRRNIRGNSGDTFRCELGPHEIALRESQGNEMMRVYIEDDAWKMELFTRDYSVIGPHPDMWARKFIDFAWEFLRSHPQTNWDTCIGEWHSHSMINRQFYDNLRVRQNSLTAASNTWSGRFYASHGFQPVTVEHVAIDSNDVLIATFKPIQHLQGAVYSRQKGRNP